MLLFWLLLAVTIELEIWLRCGTAAFADWAMGYVAEIFFSLDSLALLLLAVSSLEVPKRLVTKLMFITLVMGIASRIVCFSAHAAAHVPAMASRLYPILAGSAAVYCGLQQVCPMWAASRQKMKAEDPIMVDPTQTMAVRICRRLLGSRFCEFYDEDSEAIFVVEKGKLCMSLLGVATACAAAVVMLFSADVIAFKAQEFPDTYLNIHSSVLGLFTVRALFFCLGDMMVRADLAAKPQYGLGPVLVVCGLQFLLAGSGGISIVAAVIQAAATLVVARCVLWLRRPRKKADDGGPQEASSSSSSASFWEAIDL
eukprot:TRINITY_DN21480_c2_g1_i1.p1 TRINITY_DN21480_c2_g1~~TRINITY_DN21480_c2_g1_i1.p1  ORF type:complete len:312 (+),score=76.85 TRINITY_DN21480_c2_g1_i1:702-1637(+)